MKQLNLDNYPIYIEQFRYFIEQTSPISDSSWKKMVAIMKLWRVEKDVKLLDYMEVESAVRFLNTGIVKCEDTYNDQSFVYDFRVAPIVLSETVSFFNNIPSRITLSTLSECDFIELPSVPFKKLIETHLDISMFATRCVANYLGMTHYKQALLRTLTAESRYKHFLKEFPSVALSIKSIDIASYIDVRPDSLSRIRKNGIWLKEEADLEVLSNELEVLHRKEMR